MNSYLYSVIKLNIFLLKNITIKAANWYLIPTYHSISLYFIPRINILLKLLYMLIIVHIH